jgi:hypothetical protein
MVPKISLLKKKVEIERDQRREKETVGLQTHGRPWSKTHGWVSPAVGLLKCWPRGSSSGEYDFLVFSDGSCSGFFLWVFLPFLLLSHLVF